MATYYLTDKMCFTDAAFKEKTDEERNLMEEKWFEYHDYLQNEIMTAIKNDSRLFANTIIIKLNAVIDGLWRDRLAGFLHHTYVKSIEFLDDNKLMIQFKDFSQTPKSLTADRIVKSINICKDRDCKLKSEELKETDIIDEDKSVRWNREEVRRRIYESQNLRNLYNSIRYVLERDLMTFFAYRVREEYSLTDSAVTDIENMLKVCVPNFNEKDADKVYWETIQRRMNVILSVFKPNKNATS